MINHGIMFRAARASAAGAQTLDELVPTAAIAGAPVAVDADAGRVVLLFDDGSAEVRSQSRRHSRSLCRSPKPWKLPMRKESSTAT